MPPKVMILTGLLARALHCGPLAIGATRHSWAPSKAVFASGGAGALDTSQVARKLAIASRQYWTTGAHCTRRFTHNLTAEPRAQGIPIRYLGTYAGCS
jgi:hypothetical protein